MSCGLGDPVVSIVPAYVSVFAIFLVQTLEGEWLPLPKLESNVEAYLKVQSSPFILRILYQILQSNKTFVDRILNKKKTS